jgi:hypothetical protein
MRSILLLAAPAFALSVLAACGDDSADPVSETTTDTEADTGGGGGTGTLAVALEPIEGVLIEGFELGVRVESADGEVLDRVVWNDFVAAEGDGTIEAFYESVYETEVPAGTVTVLAAVSVGIGPPPEPVDPDGALNCELDVEVPAGGRVEVEVALNPEGDCLSVR